MRETFSFIHSFIYFSLLALLTLVSGPLCSTLHLCKVGTPLHYRQALHRTSPHMWKDSRILVRRRRLGPTERKEMLWKPDLLCVGQLECTRCSPLPHTPTLHAPAWLQLVGTRRTREQIITSILNFLDSRHDGQQQGWKGLFWTWTPLEM